MKKAITLILCLSMACMCTAGYAAETFEYFSMFFRDKSTFFYVIDDTTSVVNADHGRLYITGTDSPVKSVFRCAGPKNNVITNKYYVRLSADPVFMYYNKDLKKGARVSLEARPDSSVANCYITGKFGAG